MPAWFPAAGHALTLGYPSLLSKALVAISQQLLAFDLKEFSSDVLMTHGKQALALDLPHIDALRILRKGGTFRKTSIIRHGDWLSFAELAPTHLMPELQ
ncbi:hypothetical protein WI26_24310 [Burkholderia diffusa]|nr:hypothetical protein WI26_24310 [Burkholderia diffusa]